MDEKLKKMLQEGTKLANVTASQAIGAVVGSICAGPVGAAAGATAGTVLQRVGEEIANRVLSPREEIRVGAALYEAMSLTKKRLDAGERIREDDFFQQDSSGWSVADEIAEGVMIVASREYEEKKVKFIGRMMANIAFTSSISRPYANRLIKTAERLSYTGFCCLSLAGQGKQRNLRAEDYEKGFPEGVKYQVDELYEMYQYSLLGFDQAISHSTWIKPSMMTLDHTGKDIYELMELRNVENTDIQNIIGILSK